MLFLKKKKKKGKCRYFLEKHRTVYMEPIFLGILSYSKAHEYTKKTWLIVFEVGQSHLLFVLLVMEGNHTLLQSSPVVSLKSNVLQNAP
jgi:hypothetical protein